MLLLAGVQRRRHRDDGPLTGLSRTEQGLVAGVAMAVAAAGVLRYASGVSHVVAFVVATIALAGTAWAVSFSSTRSASGWDRRPTGLLQATLANLPEFFVVIFALNGGHLIVAQTALVGSVLVNALLVLGLVIVAGARRAGGERGDALQPAAAERHRHAAADRHIHHRARRPDEHGARFRQPPHQDDLDHQRVRDPRRLRGVAEQYLRFGERPGGPGEPARVPLTTSLVLLGAAGVASAFVSDWFVHSLEPTIHSLGISQQFAGLVIVAIAAMRSRMSPGSSRRSAGTRSSRSRSSRTRSRRSRRSCSRCWCSCRC